MNTRIYPASCTRTTPPSSLYNSTVWTRESTLLAVRARLRLPCSTAQRYELENIALVITINHKSTLLPVRTRPRLPRFTTQRYEHANIALVITINHKSTLLAVQARFPPSSRYSSTVWTREHRPREHHQPQIYLTNTSCTSSTVNTRKHCPGDIPALAFFLTNISVD